MSKRAIKPVQGWAAFFDALGKLATLNGRHGFIVTDNEATCEYAAERELAYSSKPIPVTILPGHGDVRQMWIHPDDPSRRLFQTERAAQVVASGEGLNGAPACVTVVWPVPAETDASEAAA